MTTVEELRQQIGTARSQISEAETAIQEKRKEAERQRLEALETEKSLKENLSKLPVPTQLRLRQQLYAGLEGRKRLQQVTKTKEQLQSGLSEVETFKEGISKYEEDLSKYEQEVLNPFKTQVSQAEAQLAEYEKHQEAINIARKAFYEDKPELAIYGGELVQDYYRQLKQGQEESIQLAIKNMEEQAQMSFTPEIREDLERQLRETGQAKLPIIPKIKAPETLSPPKDLPRDVIIKDIVPLKKLSSGVGFVSAKGSEELMTPLPPDMQQSVKLFSTIEPYRFDPFADIKRFSEIASIKAGGSSNILDITRGTLQAIPSYITETLKTGLTKAQIALGKPFGEPQPLPLPSGTTLTTPASKISELGGTIGGTGTYFTPLGVPILASSGLTYLTPTGREQIAQTQMALQGNLQRSLPTESAKGISQLIAYGTPVAETALGLYGLKGTRFDVTRPIVREQPLIVDVKYAKGYGRTEGANERIIGRDISGKPTVIERGIPTAYVRDIGVTGYKKVVTTPLREFLGTKPIYSGTSLERLPKQYPDIFGRQLSKPNQYEKAYNLLRRYGYTDYTAKQALRQIRPQYQQIRGIGEMTIISKEGQEPIRLFTGEQITTYKAGEKGGVKFLQKQPQKLKIDETAKYFGERKYKTINEITGITETGKVKGKINEGTIDIIGFERLETKPPLPGESLLPETLVKGAGKRTERFKGVVGAEYVKEVKPFALDIESPTTGEVIFRITPETTYARYKTADISKKIIPKERRLLTGEGIADVSRAEPKIIIYDETITGLKGFKGGGKQSSPQFLEKLYKTTEQAKAETTLSLLKTKPTKTIPKTSRVTQEVTPIKSGFVAGTTGLKIIPF